MNPEISGAHEARETLLEKVFINVHLRSSHERDQVVDELSKTEWVFFRKPGEKVKVSRSIDGMPTSQEMDILITVLNITEDEVTELLIPLIRGISGVERARWYTPVSHRE